jgi:hypothetical protein
MSWKLFKEIEFDNTSIVAYHIDTRNFVMAVDHINSFEIVFSKPSKNEVNLQDVYKCINSKSKYLFTLEEVKTIINRLYVESGENKGKWRCLDLINQDNRVKNWNLKYIRIYKYSDNQYLICNNYNKPLKEDLLNSPVNKEVLNLH